MMNYLVNRLVNHLVSHLVDHLVNCLVSHARGCYDYGVSQVAWVIGFDLDCALGNDLTRG